MYIYISQVPLCSSDNFECVNKVEVNTSNCFKPCSGSYVTSFTKSEPQRKNLALIPEYDAYSLKGAKQQSKFNGNVQ